MPPTSAVPIAAILAVVVRNGEVLLVRRSNPPDQGLWGFPGGKIERGEMLEAAAARELFEETAIRAEPLNVLTALDFIARRGDFIEQHFVMIAVLCRYASGTAQAGDDACEAKWFPVEALAAMTDISKDVARVAALAL